jgi:hypothetical protein
MDNFICERCGSSYVQKKNLIHHLTRQTPCSATVKDVDIAEYLIRIRQKHSKYSDSITCEYCNVSYSNKYNLNKHLKICKQKDVAFNNKIEQIRNELRDEIQNELNANFQQIINELQQEIKTLKSASAGGIHNTTNNTAIDNSIDNSSKIQFNYFHSPIHDLTQPIISQPDFKKMMLDFFKDTKDGLKGMMAYVLFNPEFPQNHIIYKENIDTDESFGRTENDWKPISDNEAIDKVTETANSLITSFVSDPPSGLTEDVQTDFIDKQAIPLNIATDLYSDFEDPRVRSKQKQKLIQKCRKDITDCSRVVKVVRKKPIKTIS